MTVTYAPKGGMCMTCRQKLGDCSRLPFETMPIIVVMGETKFVRCTKHQPEKRDAAR